MTANGLGLCDGGEIEAQMFSLVQMINRIPNVQFSTSAPLLQNPCYVPFFIRLYIFRPTYIIPSMLSKFQSCNKE
jgi:hypothetical protein